ncbi:sensor domain-containing diguanylate cyclase [Pseudomonas sp. RIT-PI-S]|uniref:GGDEF domain-containing protein n=1 Tax=Pseudomonas sp. RIT-PI-S TaxID=3035295 RepID=UPI0021D857AA|nr:sensor domain-containing diguanylate cyclase [Pseudomonas sp. RIT-PI-S]
MPNHSARLAAKAERTLVMGSAAAIMTILGIVLFLLSEEYDSAREVALRSAKNMAQLIDSDIQRNVELYDLSLQGLIDASQNPDLARVPPSLQRQVLFGRAISAPLRGDILWINESGQIVADSLAVVPRHFDFSQRENFLFHQASSADGLRISRPIRDQLGDLKWCIAFSRRISGPDGGFHGMASGVLRLEYFSDLFKTLNIGAGSTVSLINTDGDILAHEPETQQNSLIGLNLADRPNMRRILGGGQNGYFTAISSLHGGRLLYSYTRVEGLPLLVVVALAYDDVFGPWQRTAAVICMATLGLCLGIAWLTLMFRRELRRGRRSESNLATLAATDPLTGLANRRRLDQTLELEWARAQRSGRGMAVLMIDVDHFGAFNELHGHHGGDEALRNVARVVGQSAQRPGDLAARYGGEEFVVLLVETGLSGALQLAQAIREQIETLPPLSKATTPLTVSIGVAVKANAASPPATLTALLCEADAALYRAKHEGRNRVCHADPAQQSKKTPATPA